MDAAGRRRGDPRRRKRGSSLDAPAGCMTAHTHMPLNVLLSRYTPTLSPIPHPLSVVLAKLYAGSWTLEPIAVLSMAASTPRARPLAPSFRTMLASPLKALV